MWIQRDRAIAALGKAIEIEGLGRLLQSRFFAKAQLRVWDTLSILSEEAVMDADAPAYMKALVLADRDGEYVDVLRLIKPLGHEWCSRHSDRKAPSVSLWDTMGRLWCPWWGLVQDFVPGTRERSAVDQLVTDQLDSLWARSFVSGMRHDLWYQGRRWDDKKS